jgi:hypothetical protein
MQNSFSARETNIIMIGKRETGLTRVLFCDFENEWLVKTSRKRKNK